MTRWSAHLSMLFRELPLERRPAAARAAGFERVEMWWPPAASAEPLVDELHRADLEMVCLNCYGGNIERGERGFLNVADRYEQNVAAAAAAFAFGARLGAPRINVLVGRALPGVLLRRQHETVVSTLRDIAAVAAAGGATILIEPLNERDVPGSLVPTPYAAAALIDQVASDSVLLLYDAYHAAAAGYRPADQVAEFAALIGHVQYADYPGRGVPGTGALPLGGLVEALDRAGYRGAVGLECPPAGPTPTLAELLSGGLSRGDQVE